MNKNRNQFSIDWDNLWTADLPQKRKVRESIYYKRKLNESLNRAEYRQLTDEEIKYICSQVNGMIGYEPELDDFSPYFKEIEQNIGIIVTSFQIFGDEDEPVIINTPEELLNKIRELVDFGGEIEAWEDYLNEYESGDTNSEGYERINNLIKVWPYGGLCSVEEYTRLISALTDIDLYGYGDFPTIWDGIAEQISYEDDEEGIKEVFNDPYTGLLIRKSFTFDPSKAE